MKKTIITSMLLISGAFLHASERPALQQSGQVNAEDMIQQLEQGNVSAANSLYKIATENRQKKGTLWLPILKKLAEQTFNKPVQFNALRELGNAYYLAIGIKRDWTQAERYYKSLLENFPFESIETQPGFSTLEVAQNKLTIVGILFHLSQIYRDGGLGIAKDLEKSRTYYSMISKLGDDTQKIIANYQLGIIDVEQNKLDEAIPKLENAENQTIQPDVSAGAAQILGDIYKNKGELQTAVLKYKKAAGTVASHAPARSYSAKELVFLLSQGGPGLEKNIPEAQQYALQLLRESSNPDVTQGMRAFLRKSGYKGTLTPPRVPTAPEKQAQELAAQIFGNIVTWNVPPVSKSGTSKKDVKK